MSRFDMRDDARRDMGLYDGDDFDADPPVWEHAALLIESHRRQFVGEDYQAVAQDLCDRIKNPTTEDYLALSSSPDPDCGCDFCRGAEW